MRGLCPLRSALITPAVVAVQLSAPVGDPDLLILTDAAHGLGFFFCGLGPAFADGADTFLLQC